MIKPVNEWTTTELMAEFRALHCSIHQVGCFNSRDVGLLIAIKNELGRRGYVVEEVTSVQFKRKPVKAEKEDEERAGSVGQSTINCR